MRSYVIGDVHGCIEEVSDLLGRLEGAGMTSRDRIVLVGDLLGKGPHPGEVVRLFRERAGSGQEVVLCLGNHEEKHARWRRNEGRRAVDGTPNPLADPRGELARTQEALSPEDVAFLDRAVLFHRIPDAGVLVVHGGIPPELEALPTPEELAAMSSKRRQRVERVVRLRHWNTKEDRFVPLGEEGPDTVFWATVYDGRFGHVLFGHTPFLDPAPVRFPHATALDLGCVHGGRLAAAIVEGGEPLRFVTVPARRAYYPALGEGPED